MNQELPLLDIQSAINYSNADEEFVQELRQMLIEVLPEHRDNIQHYADQKDWDSLAKEAHKLHGALSYTGTPRLKHYSKQLQLTAQEDPSPAKLKPLLQEFMDTLDQTAKSLDNSSS